MGDAVNVASRLEGRTKYYGIGVLVGEATRNAVEGVAFREVDRIKVKGKDEAIAIFEPLGLGAGIWPAGAAGTQALESGVICLPRRAIGRADRLGGAAESNPRLRAVCALRRQDRGVSSQPAARGLGRRHGVRRKVVGRDAIARTGLLGGHRRAPPSHHLVSRRRRCADRCRFGVGTCSLRNWPRSTTSSSPTRTWITSRRSRFRRHRSAACARVRSRCTRLRQPSRFLGITFSTGRSGRTSPRFPRPSRPTCATTRSNWRAP